MLLIGILMIGILSSFSLYVVKQETHQMLSENYNDIQAADQMLEILDRQDSAILTYISINEEKGIDLFTEGMQIFLNWLYRSQQNSPSNEEEVLLEKIQNKYDYYSKAFSFLQENRAQSGFQSAVTYYNTELVPTFEEIKQELRSFRDLNTESMLSKKEAIIQKADKLTLFIIIFTAIIGSLGYYLSIHKVRILLAPLSKLAQHIKSVVVGEENEQLEVSSEDEMGILEIEFNHMMTRLKHYDEANIDKMIAQKRKLETILNNIEEPFFIINDQCMVETLNPAASRYFHIKEQEGVRRHLLEVVESQELLTLIYEAISTNKEREEKIIHLAGKNMIFNVILSKCYFADHTAYKWIILMQNITQIKHTEKIRTDFIATVSHELKTPLTSIEMGISMLTNKEMGMLNVGQREVVEIIQDDVNSLSELIEELLALSKIESGNVVYTRMPTSIKTVVDASIKRFIERARYSEVKLESKISEELPLVIADGEKLVWVFNNILNNAFKYTKAGDCISISSRLNGDFMEICVQDSGMGIQEGYLEKLFERDFHHSDQDIEYRGSGIGLYLSRQIIIAHKGEIWAESKPMDGSRFIFTIPLVKESKVDEEDISS